MSTEMQTAACKISFDIFTFHCNGLATILHRNEMQFNVCCFLARGSGMFFLFNFLFYFLYVLTPLHSMWES